MPFFKLKFFAAYFSWIIIIGFGNFAANGKLIFRPLEHQSRIYQGAPPGVHVTTVHAYNPDSPRNMVTYNLPSVLDSTYFILDQNSGNLTTAKSIERAVGESYQIMVAATSSGLSELDHLDIAVTEFNQYAPDFEEKMYEAELSIQAEVDSLVLKVHAVDIDQAPHNAEVYYKMDQNLSTHFFNLDSKTGQLTVARPINTTERSLVFGIFAEDGGSPRRWAKAEVKFTVKTISVPLDITVSDITTVSAIICWMSPEFGFITGYILNYRLHGLKTYVSDDVNAGHLRTCLTLNGLADGLQYEFQVMAVNPDEIGQKTKWQQFWTLPNQCLDADCKSGYCIVTDTAPYYRCQCYDGFYGQHCGSFNKCVQNPCGNDTCVNTTSNDYYCICPDKTISHTCNSYDPCHNDGSVCQNGGICQITTVKNYTCLCTDDFYGLHCEHRNPCFSQPCFNSGICTNTSDSSFSCSCTAGFTGKHCNEDVDECLPNPCYGGSICSTDVGGFICLCSLGYTGITCNTSLQCPHDETDTKQGMFYWNVTNHGVKARTHCPLGVIDSEQKEGFAQRDCLLLDDGTVSWGPVDASMCKGKERIVAERIAGDLRSQTNGPSVIDTKQLEVTAQRINSISSYAAQDKKVAEDVVNIISNVLNANNNAIEEDENGTISENLVQFVDDFAEKVPLERGEKTSLETKNIRIVAVQWHPEVAEDHADESGALTFDIYSPKVTPPPPPPVPTEMDGITSRTLSTLMPHFSTITPDVKFTKEEKEDTLMKVFIPRQALEEVHEKIQQDVRVKCVVYYNDKLFQTKKDFNERDVNKSSTVENQDTFSMEEKTEEKSSIQIPVLQISVGNVSLKNLSNPLVYIVTMSTKRKASCVFWKEKEREWDTEGITTNQTTTQVICESTHMTAFSILLDPTPQMPIPAKHETALSLISYIGCGLSVTGLSLTILTYALFRSLNRDHQGKILLNFATSLLFLNITFLVGSFNPPDHKDTSCVVITILLHYFVLTSLAWMLVEAVNMYQMLIHVFATAERRFMLKRCILAWITPTIAVAIPLACCYDEYNYHDNGCMLSPKNPWIYYGAFFGPSCFILCINTVVFIMVARVLFAPRFATKTQVSFYPPQQVTMAQFRGAFTVMVLLGVTWVFGTFAVGKFKLTFQYIFCVLNSCQGFLIFLVRCLLYPEARLTWIQLIKYGKFKKHRGVHPTGPVSWSTNSNSIIRQQSNTSAIYKTSTEEKEPVTFKAGFWNRKRAKETPQNPAVNEMSMDEITTTDNPKEKNNVTEDWPNTHFENLRPENSFGFQKQPSPSRSAPKTSPSFKLENDKSGIDETHEFRAMQNNTNNGYKSPKSESPAIQARSPKLASGMDLRKMKVHFTLNENREVPFAVPLDQPPTSSIRHFILANDCYSLKSPFPTTKPEDYSRTECNSSKNRCGASTLSCFTNSTSPEIKSREKKYQEKNSPKTTGLCRLSPKGMKMTVDASMGKDYDRQSDTSNTTDIDDSPSSTLNVFDRNNYASAASIGYNHYCQEPKF